MLILKHQNLSNMKLKIFYLLTITATLILSCQKNTQETPANTMAKAVPASSIAQGVIPSDIGLNQIALNPGQYTWKDLDNFYRTVVLKHSAETYFVSLQKATIGHLVNQFNLLENADLNTIEFYVNEQITFDLVDPEVFIKSLERMKGNWPNEKIKDIAQKKYRDAMNFIKGGLADPNSFLEKNASRFNAINDFANSLASR